VACGSTVTPEPPAATPAPPAHAAPADPANIGRARSDLPPGYEVGDLAGRTAPVALWGLGEPWTAQPPQCAALVDPPLDPATVRGWSGSGPGGIVYAVAGSATTGLDDSLRTQCATFTLVAGHTSTTVEIIDAPGVDGGATIGLRTEATTVVEGGTETHSHADTFTAYLGDVITYVTVVTDPGSTGAPLGPDFAATLLTTTVSALRGSAASGG
jgi:hypothetical protein